MEYFTPGSLGAFQQRTSNCGRSLGPWSDSQIHSATGVQGIQLKPEELNKIAAMCSTIQQDLGSILVREVNPPNIGDWLGGFSTDHEQDPEFVIRIGRSWKPDNISSPDCLRTIPPKYPVYSIGLQSRNLISDQADMLHMVARNWNGLLKLVRVVETRKSQAGSSWAYYGIVGQLPHFDPQLWKWRNNLPLMMYSAKVGKEILMGRQQLRTPISEVETRTNSQLPN